MKLNKKKELAVRTLNVGKSRIIFNVNRLDEIKEAITKQDIRELVRAGAIIISGIKGSRTKKKKKTRRRSGSIKAKVNSRKRNYIIITRKLRTYLANLRKKEAISFEDFTRLRKEIKLGNFKSLSDIREKIAEAGKAGEAG